jgi:hypothetical protein
MNFVDFETGALEMGKIFGIKLVDRGISNTLFYVCVTGIRAARQLLPAAMLMILLLYLSTSNYKYILELKQ